MNTRKELNTMSIVLMLGMSCCLSTCSQSNTVEIPISTRNGSGPFSSGMTGIEPDSEDENNQWRKTYLKVSGIPAEWTEPKKGDIFTDIYQSVYQNYWQGNISQEWYDELQQAWKWTPDTVNLSKKPLKCQIAFAY